MELDLDAIAARHKAAYARTTDPELIHVLADMSDLLWHFYTPLVAQRDRARSIAVRLEGENAELARRYAALTSHFAAVLTWFHEKGHPGRPCLRTGWVREELVVELRAKTEEACCFLAELGSDAVVAPDAPAAAPDPEGEAGDGTAAGNFGGRA